MKTTYGALYELQSGLRSLFDRELPVHLSLRLTRLARESGEILKDAEQERKRIRERGLSDQDATEAWLEVITTEVEANLQPLTQQDLVDLETATPRTISVLSPFVE